MRLEAVYTRWSFLFAVVRNWDSSWSTLVHPHATGASGLVTHFASFSHQLSASPFGSIHTKIMLVMIASNLGQHVVFRQGLCALTFSFRVCPKHPVVTTILLQGEDAGAKRLDP
jgi:hypothetical protein